MGGSTIEPLDGKNTVDILLSKLPVVCSGVGAGVLCKEVVEGR